MVDAANSGVDRGEPLPDNAVIDYISGEPVTDGPKEQVRQRIARALFHEYGIPVESMARDFPVPVAADSGKRRTKKADIAIFEHDAEHTVDHLRRVVVCKAEPKNGTTVTKIRTHQQAKRELDELKDLMGDELSPCEYGLWTNGLDLFFLRKEVSRFGASFQPQADWPESGESLGSRSVASHARLRRAEPEMLRTTFRRCHNYIHGNEGMPKDAAFWQFLYLLFAKMHDERVSREDGVPPRFYAAFDEPFTDAGQERISARVQELFAAVKREYPLFGARDELALSPRALAFIVGELSPYDLSSTDIDAKGMAYQELVGENLRGDRGQYFTPRGAVELMVDILDPGEDETVLDPACGTGGFLRETLRHLLDGWRDEEGTSGRLDTPEQLERHRRRLEAYARDHLFGADFDPFLVRATNMNIMTLAGTQGNTFHMDSLAFPRGHLSGVGEAKEHVPFDSVDVLMTNPPFGSDIKITDRDVLEQYRDGVAQSWSRDKVSGLPVPSDTPVGGVSPEQLFIQRSVQWVREGGRVGIVLPNGILSSPGPMDEAIRRWILEHCWILASIELPVETFIVDANVNILTTLLFLKKKTRQERNAEALGATQDYPVFMAVAEKVGVDRRGNPVYQRHPDGEVVWEDRTEQERIRVNGHEQTRTLHRKRRVVDNDLPEIAKAYRQFRARHPEPGHRPEVPR